VDAYLKYINDLVAHGYGFEQINGLLAKQNLPPSALEELLAYAKNAVEAAPKNQISSQSQTVPRLQEVYAEYVKILKGRGDSDADIIADLQKRGVDAATIASLLPPVELQDAQSQGTENIQQDSGQVPVSGENPDSTSDATDTASTQAAADQQPEYAEKIPTIEQALSKTKAQVQSNTELEPKTLAIASYDAAKGKVVVRQVTAADSTESTVTPQNNAGSEPNASAPEQGQSVDANETTSVAPGAEPTSGQSSAEADAAAGHLESVAAHLDDIAARLADIEGQETSQISETPPVSPQAQASNPADRLVAASDHLSEVADKLQTTEYNLIAAKQPPGDRADAPLMTAVHQPVARPVEAKTPLLQQLIQKVKSIMESIYKKMWGLKNNTKPGAE
jgi:hypothetical protein